LNEGVLKETEGPLVRTGAIWLMVLLKNWENILAEKYDQLHDYDPMSAIIAITNIEKW